MFGNATRREVWVFVIDSLYTKKIEAFMDEYGIKFEQLTSGISYKSDFVAVYKVWSNGTILPTMRVILDRIHELHRNG